MFAAIDDEHGTLELKWLFRIDCVRSLTELGIERTVDVVPLTGGWGGGWAQVGRGVWLLGQADELLGRVRQ